jgi:hypothetical protein
MKNHQMQQGKAMKVHNLLAKMLSEGMEVVLGGH